MKKILLLLVAAMLLPMAMSAQLLDNSNLKFQHAPYALKNFDSHTRLMTPARANLGENQLILGHYDTDDYTTSGLGITGMPGTIPIATILTPSELAMFQGGKIVKFRVALAAATTVSRVFVAPVSSTGAIGQLTEWTCSVRAVGWNEIALATPYEINLGDNESLLIGFDYKQTSSNYPISAVEVGDIYPSYIYASGAWQNVGLDAYGNLSVQCIVESENFPDYKIVLNNLNVNNYVKAGDNIVFTFNTKNGGAAIDEIAVGACTYDVFIDGELVTTISNSEAFGRNTLVIADEVPSTGLTSGRHNLKLVVNSLNGEPVEDPFQASRDFIIYVNSFDRQMHLMEEFTSNSCMWCPLGARLLNTLLDMRDDVAMVAIHGNQSTVDPCNTAQCDTLQDYMGLDGWPLAAFDRSTGWEDDATIANSIGYYEQYHQQVAQELSNFFDYLAETTPSFATININSTLDSETRNAVITINGDLTSDFDTMMGEDAKLSVFLIEDSLVYRQNNEGTYVSNYVHNHVFRKALGSVFGVNINKVEGNKYSNTFEITIPSTWKTDKMEIIAFISRPLANGASGDYTDMFVNQTNMRKLGEYDEPATFLRGDVDGDERVSIADVTELIDYLLTLDESLINLDAADCDLDERISIADVTKLIDYLLTGTWEDE